MTKLTEDTKRAGMVGGAGGVGAGAGALFSAAAPALAAAAHGPVFPS